MLHQGRVRLQTGFPAYGIRVETRDILDELRNVVRVRRSIVEQGRGAIDEVGKGIRVRAGVRVLS
ncbi:hypothetical protein ACIA03_05410 [Nocardioides sp. NPDC051685]|uniref:hypothetical protein n=1 Tax=Nocardioides sp. NPDC051685 TaxID=3364334 RepID=UPI003796BD62